MAPRLYIIRIEREGTAPRWVRSIGRTDEQGCVVTWHRTEARRMSADLAQRHAARLQALLGSTLGSLSTEALEDTTCAA